MEAERDDTQFGKRLGNFSYSAFIGVSVVFVFSFQKQIEFGGRKLGRALKTLTTLLCLVFEKNVSLLDTPLSRLSPNSDIDRTITIT
jgi:hypothetical protein